MEFFKNIFFSMYNRSSNTHSLHIVYEVLLYFFLIFQDSPSSTLCQIGCVNEQTKYVCGNDSNTYRNQCEIKFANLCQNVPVKRIHRGKCGDIPTNSSHRKSNTKSSESAEAVFSMKSPLKTAFIQCGFYSLERNRCRKQGLQVCTFQQRGQKMALRLFYLIHVRITLQKLLSAPSFGHFCKQLIWSPFHEYR